MRGALANVISLVDFSYQLPRWWMEFSVMNGIYAGVTTYLVWADIAMAAAISNLLTSLLLPWPHPSRTAIFHLTEVVHRKPLLFLVQRRQAWSVILANHVPMKMFPDLVLAMSYFYISLCQLLLSHLLSVLYKHFPQQSSYKQISQGWQDGSEVKTQTLFPRAQFGFPVPSCKLPVTPVPQDFLPSSVLKGYCMHMVPRCTCRQKHPNI